MISSAHIYAVAAIAVKLMLFAVALIQCRKKKKSGAPLSPGPPKANQNAPKPTANAPNPPRATANAPNPPLDSKPAAGGKKKEGPKKNSADPKKARPKEAKNGNKDKSREELSKTCNEGQTDAEDGYQEGGTVTHENTTVDARDKTCGTKDGTPEEQKDNSNYAMAGGKVNPSVSVKRKKMKPKTLSEEQDPFDKPDKLAISKTEDADPVPSLYPKHA